MMSRRWQKVRILTPGVTILTLLAVSGCSAVGAAEFAATGQQQRAESVADSPGSNTSVDIRLLKVGDCTMGFGGETEAIVYEVDIVPCDQPHVDEYYASITVEGDTYPGDEAIVAQAKAECAAQFETFVGIPYEDSPRLYVSYLAPNKESWEANNREILCSVFDDSVLDGALTTGSLRGAAR